MASYPSSLTDSEWEIVRELIPESHLAGRGRPCTHSKREILDGIFYIVRGGIQWRMIPNDLPPWKTVYHYFRLWTKQGCGSGSTTPSATGLASLTVKKSSHGCDH